MSVENKAKNINWVITMRVLIVHNFYGSSAPSGENQVMISEKTLLEKHGHDVQTFTRHSDEIRSQGIWGKVKGGLATPWNPWMARAIRHKVDTFKPDVVHVHNSFPLISPALFYAIGNRARRVLTLHNYRLFCPAGFPMREGRVCIDCLEQRTAWPSVLHGCYRGSRLATFPLAISVALHRRLGTWTHQVDAFIALSEFQKECMAAAGLPGHKIHVKPNFYPGHPVVIPWPERDHAVVFVGRLSQEKGVENLVRAWREWGVGAPELRIVGDGPLRDKIQSMASGLPISILGQLSSADARSEIARARLLVMPSEWFECFPMVLCEAFASGTPTAVSDIGPLPSLVRDGNNGAFFPAADSGKLLEVVRAVWADQAALERKGANARRDFERLYNEDANYKLLTKIYSV